MCRITMSAPEAYKLLPEDTKKMLAVAYHLIKCNYNAKRALVTAVYSVDSEIYNLLKSQYGVLKNSPYGLENVNFNKVIPKDEITNLMEPFFNRIIGCMNDSALQFITPARVFSIIYDWFTNEEFDCYITSSSRKGSVIDQIYDIANKRRLELLGICSNKYFLNSTNETMEYLCYTGKIFEYLLEKGISQEFDSNVDSLKTLSFFLALYCAKSTSSIKSYLSNIGLYSSDVFETFNFDCDKIENHNPIAYLNYYFPKYSGTNYTISTIVRDEIINKHGVIINQILNKYGIDFAIFKTIAERKTNETITSKYEYDKSLDSNLVKLIDNAYYIYLNIADKKPSNILKSDLDYVLLSILLSSYQNNTDLSKYFKLLGIELNDIIKLTGIVIDLNNLDTSDYDENEILDLFYPIITTLDEKSIKKLEHVLTNQNSVNSNLYSRIINKISKTKVSDDFHETFEMTIEKFKEQEMKERRLSLFGDLKEEVYTFLNKVANCCYSTRKTDFDSCNIPIMEILWSIDYSEFYKNGAIKKYFSANIEDFTSFHILIQENYKFDTAVHFSLDGEKVMDYIEKYFLDIVFGGYNANKDKSEITIESVISNCFYPDFINNNQMQEFIRKNNIDISIFEDLETKIDDFIRVQEEKKFYESMNNLKNKCNDIYECLKIACKIYFDLNNKKNEIIIDKTENYKDYSILLAFLLMNTDYNNCFKNIDITFKYVAQLINYGDVGYNQIEVTDKDIYTVFKSFINKMNFNGVIGQRNDENNKKISLYYVAKRILENEEISNIIPFSKRSEIKTCLEEEIIVEPILSLNQIREQIISEVTFVPDFDYSDTNKLYDFILYGDEGLSCFSKYISQIVKETLEKMNVDTTTSDMDELAGQIYNKPKTIVKIFRPEKAAEESVNMEVIEKLKINLKENIDDIDTQIDLYREILEIIELYMRALSNYSKIFTDIKVELEVAISSETNEIKRMKIESLINDITSKIIGYAESITLMTVQYQKILDAMNKTTKLKVALKISSNDILPIISSSVIIQNSRHRKAIDLSKTLVQLLQSTITSDNAHSAQYLSDLKEMGELPEEVIGMVGALEGGLSAQKRIGKKGK